MYLVKTLREMNEINYNKNDNINWFFITFKILYYL